MEKEIKKILVETKKDFPLNKTDSIKVVDIKLATKKIIEFLKGNSNNHINNSEQFKGFM